jgi:chaperonin cofactor prefoldin
MATNSILGVTTGNSSVRPGVEVGQANDRIASNNEVYYPTGNGAEAARFLQGGSARNQVMLPYGKTVPANLSGVASPDATARVKQEIKDCDRSIEEIAKAPEKQENMLTQVGQLGFAGCRKLWDLTKSIWKKSKILGILLCPLTLLFSAVVGLLGAAFWAAGKVVDLVLWPFKKLLNFGKHLVTGKTSEQPMDAQKKQEALDELRNRKEQLAQQLDDIERSQANANLARRTANAGQ